MKRALALTSAALQVAAVVVLVLVVWQNYRLRRVVNARLAPAGQFFAGDQLPVVPVYDLTGRQKMLDLRSGRTTVAIVEPSCDLCEKTIQDVRNDPSIQLISLAPAKPTRAAVEKAGLAGNTYTTSGVKLPETIARKVLKYPQIMLVDRGTIVRVCATVSECRGEQMLAAAR